MAWSSATFPGMYTPDREAFIDLAKPGRVIPVRREVVADLLTPLTAFLRLDRETDEAAWLLESVEGGEKWGRYSFVGIAPRQLVKANVSDGGDVLADICRTAQ
ncbi:MAG: anthranilate synthase component 1, partial [Myxococcota bacterium]